jgi:hypothetical protein
MLFRLVVVILGLTSAVAAHAQWVNYPAAGLPRMSDGKPDLSGPTPRTRDGRPDLSGIWTTTPTPPEEMERLFPFLKTFAVPGDDARFFPKYFISVFADVRPDEVPMRNEAATLFKERFDSRGADTPTSRCLPAGIPMGDLLPVPRRFIQLSDVLVILYEGVNPQRFIYTDGRTHPVDPQPAWLGYSIGRWVDDTLVVETRGFNAQTWLDAAGHPHTEALHVTERFRRVDFGSADVEVTLEDAGAYTRPFSFRYRQTLTPDTDLLETVCENEKDRAILTGR